VKPHCLICAKWYATTPHKNPLKTTGCDGKLEQIFGPEARQKWPLLVIICQADFLNDGF
jgi:hypothetical protein